MATGLSSPASVTSQSASSVPACRRRPCRSSRANPRLLGHRAHRNAVVAVIGSAIRDPPRGPRRGFARRARAGCSRRRPWARGSRPSSDHRRRPSSLTAYPAARARSRSGPRPDSPSATYSPTAGSCSPGTPWSPTTASPATGARRRRARVHPRQPRGPRLPDGTRRHQRQPAAARPRRALPGPRPPRRRSQAPTTRACADRAHHSTRKELPRDVRRRRTHRPSRRPVSGRWR